MLSVQFDGALAIFQRMDKNFIHKINFSKYFQQLLKKSASKDLHLTHFLKIYFT